MDGVVNFLRILLISDSQVFACFWLFACDLNLPLHSVMPSFGFDQLLFCFASLDAALLVLLIFACSSFAFVRLLMFEERANGARYFKIGKATSLPSWIKQFGPCEQVVHDVHVDSQMALKREKELRK